MTLIKICRRLSSSSLLKCNSNASEHEIVQSHKPESEAAKFTFKRFVAILYSRLRIVRIF